MYPFCDGLSFGREAPLPCIGGPPALTICFARTSGVVRDTAWRAAPMARCAHGALRPWRRIDRVRGDALQPAQPSVGEPNHSVKKTQKLRLPYDEHASPCPCGFARAAAFGWYGV